MGLKLWGWRRGWTRVEEACQSQAAPAVLGGLWGTRDGDGGWGPFCSPSPGNLLVQTRWPGLPGGRPYPGPVDCGVLWDPR